MCASVFPPSFFVFCFIYYYYSVEYCHCLPSVGYCGVMMIIFLAAFGFCATIRIYWEVGLSPVGKIFLFLCTNDTLINFSLILCEWYGSFTVCAKNWHHLCTTETGNNFSTEQYVWKIKKKYKGIYFREVDFIQCLQELQASNLYGG